MSRGEQLDQPEKCGGHWILLEATAVTRVDRGHHSPNPHLSHLVQSVFYRAPVCTQHYRVMEASLFHPSSHSRHSIPGRLSGEALRELRRELSVSRVIWVDGHSPQWAKVHLLLPCLLQMLIPSYWKSPGLFEPLKCGL